MNLDDVLGGLRAAARHRHHPPPHDDLDGRLDARASTRFVDEVEQPIRLALSLHAADDALRSRAHAGQRPLPAAPTCSPRAARYVERAPAQGVRRVRDARRRQRPLEQARAARRRCSTRKRLQGQPDPVQPDRRATTARRASAIDAFKARARPSAACPRPCGSRAAATSPPPAASSPPTPNRRRDDQLIYLPGRVSRCQSGVWPVSQLGSGRGRRESC